MVQLVSNGPSMGNSWQAGSRVAGAGIAPEFNTT